MRKSLAGILLALLTTLGVFVAAAAPAGAASTNTLGSSSKPIFFTGYDTATNDPVTTQFRPKRAALNGDGNGVVLIGEMKYKGEKKQDVAVPVLPDTSGSAGTAQ